LNKDLKIEPKMKPVASKKPDEAPVPKVAKPDPNRMKFEAEIERKIERNLLFIKKLQESENAPPYAFSLLESARHNKTNVV
jgi:hypothetical protein